MKVSPLILSIAASLFVDSAQAVTVETVVDLDTQMVRLDFGDLPPYEQIALEGVTALYWCNCLDGDNPSTLMGTGFTVNGSNLQMQYEGSSPPSTNYITYFYLDGFYFAGFESVDWIVVTELGGGQQKITADRPIVLLPEPEVSTGFFCGAIGLALVCWTRRAERARVRLRP